MYKATDNVALMLNVNTERPLQAQLFEQVRAMIIDGQLKAGTALPATRALSERLGVSRNTVVLAYDRLLAEGYIESKRSIGTFVSTAIPDSGLLQADNDHEPQEIIEAEIEAGPQAADLVKDRHGDKIYKHFSPLNGQSAARPGGEAQDLATKTHENRPEIDFKPFTMDAEDFPLRSWRRILNRKSQDVERFFPLHNEPLGCFDLRRAIADHLGPARGIITEPDEVMIFGSLAEARMILAELLLSPDAMAICETPSSLAAVNLFAHKGAKLAFMPMDEHGLMTEHLPKMQTIAQQGGLLYVSPSCQIPLGSGMALARRIELLEWAREARVMVIEDEADSDFYQSGSPPTALKGLDGQGSVIYLGGFEKSLGASFGLAYLVLPQKLVALAAELKQMLAPGPSLLNQAVMAEFIECGAYDRHLRKFRKNCMEKRKHLIDQLKTYFSHLPPLPENGGLQLLLPLPPGTELDTLKARSLQELDIGIYNLAESGFYLSDQAIKAERYKEMQRSVLLGFSGLQMNEISRGVEALAGLLNEQITPMNAVNGDMR
ncbi:MAG: transcriptional regulator [Rhodomicrobium sp.]|nr:MAG: transcriptional regulator [Rhodomicrobium sp.]